MGLYSQKHELQSGTVEMAVRGVKPKPAAVKQLMSRPGKRHNTGAQPAPSGKPSPPTPMHGRPLALWRRYVSRAWWLSVADSPKAWLWCYLHAEAEESVAAMTAARIGQLRALGSELGFDPASRARMGEGPPSAGPESEFF